MVQWSGWLVQGQVVVWWWWWIMTLALSLTLTLTLTLTPHPHSPSTPPSPLAPCPSPLTPHTSPPTLTLILTLAYVQMLTWPICCSASNMATPIHFMLTPMHPPPWPPVVLVAVKFDFLPPHQLTYRAGAHLLAHPSTEGARNGCWWWQNHAPGLLAAV